LHRIPEWAVTGRIETPGNLNVAKIRVRHFQDYYETAKTAWEIHTSLHRGRYHNQRPRVCLECFQGRGAIPGIMLTEACLVLGILENVTGKRVGDSMD
jgi:hypothetical protein